MDIGHISRTSDQSLYRRSVRNRHAKEKENKERTKARKRNTKVPGRYSLTYRPIPFIIVTAVGCSQKTPKALVQQGRRQNGHQRQTDRHTDSQRVGHGDGERRREGHIDGSAVKERGH